MVAAVPARATVVAPAARTKGRRLRLMLLRLRLMLLRMRGDQEWSEGRGLGYAESDGDEA
jgi:hypothetical protein